MEVPAILEIVSDVSGSQCLQWFFWRLHGTYFGIRVESPGGGTAYRRPLKDLSATRGNRPVPRTISTSSSATMKNDRSLAVMATTLAVLATAALTAFAEVPRPEHPRPDLFRENWMTLNGEWQFEIDKAADGEARGLTYGKDLSAQDHRAVLPGEQTIGPRAGQYPST